MHLLNRYGSYFIPQKFDDQSLRDMGFDPIHEVLNATPAFHLFASYIKQSNLSKCFFTSYLHTMLLQAGININIQYIRNDQNVKQNNCDISDIHDNLNYLINLKKELSIQEFSQAVLIDEHTYDQLKFVTHKTKEEWIQIDKYLTYETFKIPKKKKRLKQEEKELLFDLSNIRSKVHNLNELVLQAGDNLIEQQKYCLQKFHGVYIDSDILTKDNFQVAINQQMLTSCNEKKLMHLKMFYAVRGLWCIGFKSIHSKEIVKNPIEKLKGWMNYMKKKLKFIYPTKFMFDESTDTNDKEYIKFFNGMLSIVSLKLEKSGSNRTSNYHITRTYDTILVDDLICKLNK